MDEFKKIVATVFVKDVKQARLEILNSFAFGADIVEIRIDAFPDPKLAEKLFDLIPKHRLIFSGNRDKIVKEELIILLKAQKEGAFIDLPFSTSINNLPDLDHGRLVISFHKRIDSFSVFQKITRKMSTVSRFIKIVPPKENIFYCAQFLKWIQRMNRRYNLIAFPTGDESKFARILCLAYGSKWTYCLSPNSAQTAKGQIRIRELISYNPKAISKNSILIGLLGYPLNFTLSPKIWNSWLSEHNIDAKYVPFISKDIQNAIEAFKLLKVKFFAVTTPHKVQIKIYIDKL
ncbi:MAG: type I 3-dehydroquinate dehydratase, partial [Acidobacteria bacterium]|nr:type I 3-dehydroquinate dehydratase [Acidobacteriota bacterium]